MIDIDRDYSHWTLEQRDVLRRKFDELGIITAPRVTVVTSPPKADTRTCESEIVRVLPGMSADTLMLTAYRGNGAAFIRMELPAELAEEWIAGLERYTLRKDDTRRPGLRLVE